MSKGSFSPKARDGNNENVVLLHQFPRSSKIPNASSFCLKLETYLRMANIEYETKLNLTVSKKGKMPWIEHNGKSIADSQFSIVYLNDTLNINLDESLSEEDKGIAHSLLQLTEHSLYWVLVHWRWIMEPDMATIQESSNIPWLVRKYLQCKVKKSLTAQGLFAHTNEEINEIAQKDLKSISQILGNKRFLFGDKAHEVDAAVFGQLAQFRWAMPNSPYESYMKQECPNLWTYCETMRNEYWSDWEQVCSNKNK